MEKHIEIPWENISPASSYPVLAKAARRLVKAPPQSTQQVKIAILAAGTMEHFIEILRYWLALTGLRAEFYMAPFDTVIPTILDEQSELYAFSPDIVWIFSTHRDVNFSSVPGSERGAVCKAVADAVKDVTSLWQVLKCRMDCTILQNNLDIPQNDHFGNISGSAAWGRRAAAHLYNFELAACAGNGVIIFDLEYIAAQFGKQLWCDYRYWYHSKHLFNLDASGLIAYMGARLIAAHKGLSKKCLVLDLDNTLWGGVIGDDGISGIRLGTKADGEAFTSFQSYIKSLKERGVILAVCSKNEEENAKEPFLTHPDMRLSLDDIAVFMANWENKVDNIRSIAKILNIGLDSLVFVDDNPAEREIVRTFLPMVSVPELPDDPAEYISALDSWHYFEIVALSSEDLHRANYYKENAQRAQLKMTYADTASYLGSLEMFSTAGYMDEFHLPRMSQLVNKSNQFHLTGTRYSEAQMQSLHGDPAYRLLYFTLRDKFGDNGLISVLILCKLESVLHIDTWVMSCRVLGRTMEEFIFSEIISVAYELKCSHIQGKYVPTSKNKLVANLFQRLGFAYSHNEDQEMFWKIECKNNVNPVSYVKKLVK